MRQLNSSPHLDNFFKGLSPIQIGLAKSRPLGIYAASAVFSAPRLSSSVFVLQSILLSGI